MGKKFINPTDQARKEARRRELKKNKKQRQQVREAVIKQKDPKQILSEMEALDKLEFDINNPPPYSAKVIQDKRRKLKDQLHKIHQFYQKQEPKLAYEIKQLELDYDRRYKLMDQYFSSIQQAQKVKLDEIPLPSDEPSNYNDLNTVNYLAMISSMPPLTIPPPPTVEISAPPKSILKSGLSKNLPGSPPGPPSGAPPDLEEFECDDDENELGLSLNDDHNKALEKAKKIRFAPTEVSKLPEVSKYPVSIAAPPPPPPPAIPVPVSSSYGYSQPTRQYYPPQTASSYHPQPSVQTSTASSGSATTTIEAKPVLRKTSEIVRFVPTALIVKRDPNIKAKSDQYSSFGMSQQQQEYSNYNPLRSVNENSTQQRTANATSADAAYESFMKEIGKLL